MSWEVGGVWTGAGASLGALVHSCGGRGGLGAVLERFGAVLGRSWGDVFGGLSLTRFRGRFWERKGCPKGGIWGGNMEPKSIPKRYKI